MHYVKRLPLEKNVTSYLVKRKKKINILKQTEILNTEDEWKKSRGTKSIIAVLNKLQEMAGNRARCMYCLDSHGTDIEHFWPKADYYRRMFNWNNLLLCCTECGRLKGSQFPLNGRHPLLIDPTKENPWNYLDFDPLTGNISARFDRQNNTFFCKGTITTEALRLNRREHLASGYKITYSRLIRKITNYNGDPNISDTDFAKELISTDDHKLLGWVLTGTGANEIEFINFRQKYQLTWLEVEKIFKNQLQ